MNEPARHYKKRTPTVIRRIEGSEKRAPNSIREILVHIRERFYPGDDLTSQLQFLDSLAQTWGPKRYGVTAPTRAIFRTTEHGQNGISYAHLEMYARALNVPVALLLILSRVRSELYSPTDGIDPIAEETKVARARRVLAGIRAATKKLESQITKGGMDAMDLDMVILAYQKAGGPPSMP